MSVPRLLAYSLASSSVVGGYMGWRSSVVIFNDREYTSAPARIAIFAAIYPLYLVSLPGETMRSCIALQHAEYRRRHATPSASSDAQQCSGDNKNGTEQK